VGDSKRKTTVHLQRNRMYCDPGSIILTNFTAVRGKQVILSQKNQPKHLAKLACPLLEEDMIQSLILKKQVRRRKEISEWTRTVKCLLLCTNWLPVLNDYKAATDFQLPVCHETVWKSSHHLHIR
jgi:hypothetical protein